MRYVRIVTDYSSDELELRIEVGVNVEFGFRFINDIGFNFELGSTL